MNHLRGSSRGAATNRARANARLNTFADLLAEELSPTEAATRMGLNPGSGWRLLATLRSKLGSQAV